MRGVPVDSREPKSVCMPDCLEVAPRYRSLLSSQGLRTLDDFFVHELGERLDKPGLELWRQRWRLRLQDSEVGARTFYLKRFVRPPLRRQWGRWLGGAWSSSTAGLEWNNSISLAASGVRAAEAAAYGQTMCGPLEVRSFVILSEAAGESLECWVPRNLPPVSRETNWRVRRARLDALARFVAKFHAEGFAHRDLYLCHVFYDAGCEKQTAVGQFCLIDLQRVFRPRWRPRRWIVKDLAALNFSTPTDRVGLWERLRFLCRYVRSCDKFGSARGLVRSVAAKTNRIAQRYKRLAGSGR